MDSKQSNESLKDLDKLESLIASSIQSAASSINELAKDKPVAKQVENHTQNFLKSLEEVESGLSKQIIYLTKVCTNQPHEGSLYGPQKDLQMTLHRNEHIRSRLNELERMRLEHRAQTQAMMDTGPPQEGVQPMSSTPGGYATIL